jgi:hypothetical protein
MLIGGIAVIAVCAVIARRDYRRHKARRSSAGRPAQPPDRAIHENL